MQQLRRHSPKKIQAYRLFFPAASLHAAIAIPLSVCALTFGNVWPVGHAYEMLFGFALAVVAGYTLGPMAKNPLLILFVLWLSARLTIVTPFNVPAYLLNILFAIGLAVHIVPKFLVAKKWRNRMISPLFLCICAIPILHMIAAYTIVPLEQHILLLQSVLLFSLLMVFMGGRIIAPAAAGESERQGLILENRVQPRFEATLIILLFTAALALFSPKGHLLAGLSCIAAGIVTVTRLYRWRLWRCRKRPDLIGLGLGYGWLALGLVLYGGAIFLNAYITTALHVITIGALGTLSTGVMMRIHTRHTTRHAPHGWIVLTTATLIAMATLSRGTADLIMDKSILLLWAAATGWSCAYLLLASYLLLYGKSANKGT